MSRITALLLLAAVAFAGEPTRLELAQSNIPFGKTWYGVYLQGKKSGFASRTISREKDEIVVSTVVHVEISSMGKPVTMDIVDEARFAATPPYTYQGGKMVMASPKGKTDISARREGDQLLLKLEASREMKKPAPDFTLADALGGELWVREPRKVGDTITVRAYTLATTQNSLMTMRVGKVEEAVVQGVPLTYYHVLSKDSAMGPLGTSRISSQGEMLSMVMGNFMESRLEPEKIAKQLEKSGDLFFESFIRPDQPLGDPRKVRALVLEVTGKGIDAIQSGPQQTVTPVGEGVIRLALGVKHGAPVKATEAEIAENLEETVEFPVKNATIQALARGAIGDATTVREKVDRLVYFVSRYVDDTLRPEPVTVLQVMAEANGDCQEHSIFFATLARAAGIPARTVAGLGYVPGKMNAFGGHAWNEVVIDGHWIPVDSTWHETTVDAAHIRVGEGMRGLTQMSWALGALKLKVIEVERDEGK